jgi:uncharacterized coiled-coil protein SlyX
MRLSEIHNLKEGVADLPAGAGAQEQLDILTNKLNSAKKALNIAMSLEDPTDRKKYWSRIMNFFVQLRPLWNQAARQLEQEMGTAAVDEAVTDMPDGADLSQQLDILTNKLAACSRALGIANKLQTPEEKRKYQGKIMGFFNQLRPMFKRISKEIEAQAAQ